MYLPIGYTEEQVLATMKRVLNQLAFSFKFGCYDPEDMIQEGYIYAMEALEAFDETQSSLETFLHNHVRNRFINMRRDKLERKQPPCVVCPFYNKKNDKCNEFVERKECNKWNNWNARNARKRLLMESPQEGDEVESGREHNVAEKLANAEALDLLDRYMPISLRADYRRLVEGVSLPKSRRDKVIDAAREIFEKYGVTHE